MITRFLSFTLLAAIYGQAGLAQDARALPLPDGEVLLQVWATGKSVIRADTITLTVPVSTGGATAAEARASNSAAADRLRATLKAAGVAPEAVMVVPPLGQLGYVGNEAFDMDQAPGQLPVARPKSNVTTFLEVRLSRSEQVQRVRDILADLGLNSVLPPKLSLNDDGPARAAAIRDGVARAKAEAESFSTALNLHIVRIKKVGNSCSLETTSIAMFASQLAGMTREGPPYSVITNQQVCIDFLAIPR